ncbi:hypothetical protein AVV36_gp214 [Pectobacterium bacteriophage PM2]|uniref:Uncharacterized protein n=1 Tax=Pectobacterium bacteriophage PM2 TaxID=1429794 RepID=A0A0A0Q0N6_9CAUD|nr:hypothetical protein AVV36_gp214 [Pectobacterium bacteriophage PM2]AHY25196.1 hypothetical protein PM2_234 [Pectobacterium bacteriophage PM2]
MDKEFGYIFKVTPNLPASEDCTGQFKKMLHGSGVDVQIVNAPIITLGTIKANSSFTIEIASFKADNLEFLCSQIAEAQPHLVFLKECYKQYTSGTTSHYIVRMNLLKF